MGTKRNKRSNEQPVARVAGAPNVVAPEEAYSARFGISQEVAEALCVDAFEVGTASPGLSALTEVSSTLDALQILEDNVETEGTAANRVSEARFGALRRLTLAHSLLHRELRTLKEEARRPPRTTTAIDCAALRALLGRIAATAAEREVTAIQRDAARALALLADRDADDAARDAAE